MRLADANVGKLPPDVVCGAYERVAQRTGIVHLGIGAFHRAHQAVYTEEAMAAGDRDWAITGVSLRSREVRDALEPQDGLYTVTARSRTSETVRLIGSVAKVKVAPEAPNDVANILASANTKIVTLIVTEKGYLLRPDGSLDVAAADGGENIYTTLARAFDGRATAGLPGLTLVSCDNLASNGAVLERAMAQYLEARAPALERWFDRECTCPATMVDRIVPAVTGDDLDRTEMRLGMRDDAAIFTEEFRQWVIEDRFATARPRWEAGGAIFTSDVGMYETAKLRLLNGAHSALSYLGLLAGHEFVHEAIADASIRPTIDALMRREAPAGFDAAPGQDLGRYADELIIRFENAALCHRLAQIAMDGSQKIGPRWLASLADNRLRGHRCPGTLRALAAWIVYVRGDGAAVQDPLAARLSSLWTTAGRSGIVRALFGPTGHFSDIWQADVDDAAALEVAIDAFDRPAQK